MNQNLDLTSIYEEHYQKVFAYIYSHINNYYDAQDLSEEVFTKINKKLDTFDETKSSLNTWIFNITKNTLIDFYRTKHDSYELLDNYDYVSEDDPVSPSELVDLSNALNKLDKKERDIIVLRYYKGYSLKEIAELMHISYGITKIKHNKALKEMKKFMEL